VALVEIRTLAFVAQVKKKYNFLYEILILHKSMFHYFYMKTGYFGILSYKSGIHWDILGYFHIKAGYFGIYPGVSRPGL